MHKDTGMAAPAAGFLVRSEFMGRVAVMKKIKFRAWNHDDCIEVIGNIYDNPELLEVRP